MNTPSGCGRPISATAGPMKPAPSVAFSTSLSASPMTLLIAIIPAKAPEMIIAIMVILKGEMPAYLAPLSDSP